MRKKALLSKCRGNIGDLGCQLRYLKAELNSYFPGVNSLLKSSNSVLDCTFRVIIEFENSADQSYGVQNYRYGLAQNYYKTFAGGSSTPTPTLVYFGKTYIVQNGDTLFEIAHRFGTNLYVLLQLNRISSVYSIYPGQVLRLP